MKSELFPNFGAVQKYIINGDRFHEVEFESNLSALLAFLKRRFGLESEDPQELCQKIKELILSEDEFDQYLKHCDFELYEAIVFLSTINAKKIFTSKVVSTLKNRYEKLQRAGNSSGVRMERPKANKRNIRKAAKSRKLPKTSRALR